MRQNILLITKDAGDAETLRGTLDRTDGDRFTVHWATTLASGLARLNEGGIDAMLVDLRLPDSQGQATFDALFSSAPRTPIMTLCADGDEALARQVERLGSDGYFLKPFFDSYIVPQSLRNVMRPQTLEERILNENARAETTLNSISDAVIGTDLAGNVDYLNAAAESMTGWSRNEARGQPLDRVMKIINSTTREPKRNPVDMVLQQNKPMGLTAGTLLIQRDGSEVAIEDSAAPIQDSSGNINGAVIVVHDVTAAKAMAMKMAYLAQHDFLTNLPNRVLLSDRITQAIKWSERNGKSFSLLFLDLDNFKLINDSLGHEIGDKLLVSVAQRLSDCIRRSDTVSRQGGDEFLILLMDETDAQDAGLVAGKILDVVSQPHSIAGHELIVTASIGISSYPRDVDDAEALIKNADAAMYKAKEGGRNTFRYFSSSMRARVDARRAIEADLRGALVRQEFLLHYQPEVDLNSGKIIGCEALLRWKHPNGELMLPGDFIPIAEECGLILSIGRWVLREACAQAKSWHDQGRNPGSMAVNVSALELAQNDFIPRVKEILNETGLDSRMLQIEITESVLMRETKSSAMTLHKLKEMGVVIAMDDFGTGYSSLSYLTNFPIDIIKVDRSFVAAIRTSADNCIIISAIIALGASLKQRVIVEGIEDAEQLAFLKAINCREGQGFLFSRPVSAEKFANLLYLRGDGP
ncbi:EAL domain-containing protein [Xanthobacter sp. KR7-225]|uniref:putative bifunctional diguanylate cyclase/phosphodiesterase n=1 Tax=Xanthobacter sp. KR7-225 TaxID=3156613 RepID=UPI0032B4BE84